MQLETARWRRALLRIPATATHLWLETKLVSGGRPWVLLTVALAWFAVFATWALMREEPWASEIFYTQMLVLPGSLLIVGMGMGSVMGELDTRQLETTFVSPTGRFGAWLHRLVAIVLAAWGSMGLLSLLTWLILDRSHAPLQAWLQSLVPLLFLLAFTLLLSLIFKSAAGAGLVAGAYLVGWLLFGDLSARLDYWFNPFGELSGVTEQQAFFRIVVYNRSLHLAAAGLFFALAFWLLQRRERLL